MSDTYDNNREMNDQAPETEVMTAYIEPEDEDVIYDEFGQDSSLPGRPRRELVNRYTVLLVILLVGAACFYAGVRVEKSKVPSTSSAGSAFSALASRFGAASATSKSGSTSRTGAAGFAGRFGGFGGAGGGGTSGTISTIAGDTLYVTEASGNTVKVKLSAATTLTKSEKVAKSKLYPGDTVTATGSTSSNGTISATSVSDSGATSSTSGTASTGSTGSSAGSSGLSSLFGG